jgi:hypothetical protein
MQTCQPHEWCLHVVATLRKLQEPANTATLHRLHSLLALAECNRQLSELNALILQALLAMAEKSDFAVDYLDMADAVATTALDRRILMEIRAAHHWLAN